MQTNIKPDSIFKGDDTNMGKLSTRQMAKKMPAIFMSRVRILYKMVIVNFVINIGGPTMYRSSKSLRRTLVLQIFTRRQNNPSQVFLFHKCFEWIPRDYSRSYIEPIVHHQLKQFWYPFEQHISWRL